MGCFDRQKGDAVPTDPQAAIRQALQNTPVPGLKSDIVSLGLLSAVRVSAGQASITLEVSNPDPVFRKQLSEAVRTAAEAVPSIESVGVVLMSPPPKGRPSPFAGGHKPFGDRRAGAGQPAPQQAPAKEAEGPVANQSRSPFEDQAALAGVNRVVAVASGKGGVGKSSVALNLAVSLAQLGQRVGLLDGDIYGPSLAIMAGHRDKPQGRKDGKIQPVEKYGLQMMSMGFLVDSSEALAWRGPMLMGVLQQFLRDVAWERLDYLIVDLPPGTGDVHLSLAQITQVYGAVMVTTPEDLALADTVRSVRMFEKIDVPILGIVENMSAFVCDDCGAETFLFGQGGGARLASHFRLPLLARIPIDPLVAEQGDKGTPLVIAHPNAPTSQAFLVLAQRVLAAEPVVLG